MMSEPHISGRALVYGSLAGWGLSAALSLVFNLVLSHLYLNRGLPLADVQAAMLSSTAVIASFAAISLVASLFGGWASARLAGHDHVRHGVWTGLFYLGTGLLAFASPFPNVMPTWHIVVTTTLTLPLAILGSWMAGRAGDTPYPAMG